MAVDLPGYLALAIKGDQFRPSSRNVPGNAESPHFKSIRRRLIEKLNLLQRLGSVREIWWAQGRRGSDTSGT